MDETADAARTPPLLEARGIKSGFTSIAAKFWAW